MKAWFWWGAAAGLYGAAWLAARRQARRAETDFPPTGELITVEGVPIHFVRRGIGSPVVLLHGSDGFLQDYALTILDRVAAEFDAIALDRPGHGYSEIPPGERATAPVQARLIHSALGRLGVTRPLLVGHSWSCLLLLYYAWRYPRDVAGLVLLAPWVYPGRSGEPLLRVVSQPWIARALHPIFAPVRRIVVRHFLSDAFHPESIPTEYGRQAESLWLRAPRNLAATARENSGNRKALAGFSPSRVSPNIPILIIVGDCDRVTKADRQALRLRAELPHIRLEVVAGAGHMLLHSAPQAVLQAIRTVSQLSGEIQADALSPQVAPMAVGSDPPLAAGVGHTSSLAHGSEDSQNSHGLARALVMRFGWNSAAYQILNADIDHWFSDDGEACVGYVNRGGVRVVAGAPICAGDRLAAVALEFENESRQAGQSVCYFGAAERLRSALLALPAHSAVPIGAQPGWRPESWGSIVQKHRSLRAQLNRARNKGVGVTEESLRNPDLAVELQRCLDEWLSTHGGFTLHFLTEPVALSNLGDRRLFVARRHDTAIGFLVATPVPDRHGWLVEQIVRGSAAPNGTAELLIDTLVRSLAQEGAEFVTLGLAPLSRRAGVAPAHSLWLRLLLGWVRAHGKRFYNFEGLDAFKSKFQPDFWEPIYAISNEPRFSVRTLYGVTAAFTGGAPLAAIARVLIGAVRQEWFWLRVKAGGRSANRGPDQPAASSGARH